MAQFENLPPEVTAYFKKKFKENLDFFKNQKETKVLETKVQGNASIIIIRQMKADDPYLGVDIDPLYFLKQKDGWKLLPELTQWKIVKDVSKKDAPSFEALEKWYKLKKPELKKKEKESDKK